MKITEILEELAYDSGQLPREAIEAAIPKRMKITPYLLDILENAIERVDEIVENDNYQAHLYSMYLLAQFREGKAYPLITRLVSFPGEIPHAVLGDILTEDLSRILASVCNGNTGLIHALIEDPQINPYVRAAGESSMVVLVGCRQKERNEVIDYYRSLFDFKLEKAPSFAWDNLISCCCELYPEELYSRIRSAYSAKLVDRAFIDIGEVEAALSKNKESHLDELMQTCELIEDTVVEMEKWMAIHL